MPECIGRFNFADIPDIMAGPLTQFTGFFEHVSSRQAAVCQCRRNDPGAHGMSWSLAKTKNAVVILRTDAATNEAAEQVGQCRHGTAFASLPQSPPIIDRFGQQVDLKGQVWIEIAVDFHPNP